MQGFVFSQEDLIELKSKVEQLPYCQAKPIMAVIGKAQNVQISEPGKKEDLSTKKE